MSQSDVAGTFEYDQVAYPGAADAGLHPRSLELVAALFGIPSAPISSCRVLELGCADGANLLPYAAEFPDSHFVGVDLAAARIDDARQTAETLGLKNIEFHHLDVCDAGEISGAFNYILCPGVFSWVPEAGRDAILRICQERLSPGGLAAISFNVLPGWNHQGTIRELIRRHVRHMKNPQEQIKAARQVATFITRNATSGSPHGVSYAAVLEALQTASDHYLYHDYISDFNQPFYFHEFAGMLERHGLQYAADTDISQLAAPGVTEEARRILDRTPVLEREQLLDFLVNTSYRRAVICRSDEHPDRTIDANSMTGLHVTLTDSCRNLQFDPVDPSPLQVKFGNGSMVTSQPLGKAVLKHLIDVWPQTVPVNDLYDIARNILRIGPDASGHSGHGPALVAQSLLAGCGAGLVRAFRTPPSISTSVPERPAVDALTRYHAAKGRNLVNRWHQNLGVLPNDQRFVISQLDGTRTVAELERLLAEHQTRSPAAPVSDGYTQQTVPEMLSKFAADLLLSDVGS